MEYNKMDEFMFKMENDPICAQLKDISNQINRFRDVLNTESRNRRNQQLKTNNQQTEISHIPQTPAAGGQREGGAAAGPESARKTHPHVCNSPNNRQNKNEKRSQNHGKRTNYGLSSDSSDGGDSNTKKNGFPHHQRVLSHTHHLLLKHRQKHHQHRQRHRLLTRLSKFRGHQQK